MTDQPTTDTPPTETAPAETAPAVEPEPAPALPAPPTEPPVHLTTSAVTVKDGAPSMTIAVHVLDLNVPASLVYDGPSDVLFLPRIEEVRRGQAFAYDPALVTLVENLMANGHQFSAAPTPTTTP